MTEPTNLNVRGAVDLGALAAQRDAQQRAANAPAGVVIDVTEANFQSEVLDRSATVPVVLDLWASWCQPCKTLTPILEGLAADFNGRFVLAKVDVDANQRIAQAFQVQSIPSVFAVIAGQPLPLFQGALPEPQVRQYLEALLAEADKAGVGGSVSAPSPGSAGDQPPVDADEEAAFAAMEAGDWATAEQAFRRLRDRRPTDEQAAIGLATAGLYRRVDGQDAAKVMTAAESAPDDVARQVLAADMLVASGDADAAFTRLIDTVRRTSGDDRVAARAHLLELFEVVGPTDPRVAKARITLANALF